MSIFSPRPTAPRLGEARDVRGGPGHPDGTDGHFLLELRTGPDSPAVRALIPVLRQLGVGQGAPREAVCAFAVRVAEKLRGENAKAAAVQVFVQTPRPRDVPQHVGQAVISLPTPTAHTPDIIDAGPPCPGPGFPGRLRLSEGRG